MNSVNHPAAQSLITWKRAQSPRRLQRLASVTFRIGRNLFAVLGVFFAYLIVLGYLQYQHQAAKFEVQCAVSRCM
ncbi:hypothetical protein OHZ10_29370 [Burkholderia arboris]|uniref:Uncharacterized protein n=1 Tax=Burkholderia arboris TaxID=488730 RepID=A0ABZ3DN67_9BURK